MVEHIGSQVNVPGTRGKGILRYHGSIHGKTGIFAGIELLGPIALTRGKNSGDVEGFKYFEVQSPMSGLFLPFERLKAVNPQIDHTRDMINEATLNFNNDTLDDEIPTFSGLSSPNYSLQPILKQYESELDERDRKISKIRNEFESAREDWRQNLDIMVNTYEANEAYYETKIRELQSKEIKALQQQLDKTNSTKLLCERENTIKELEQKLGESLSKELDSLNINDAAAMNEMTFREEVEQLRLQLDARPTIEELTELQDNIDEMVRLHNNEVFFKQEELQRVTNENSKLQVRLERALEGSIITNRISDNTSHDSMTINSLPIYKPENDTDPSTGKDNWCGLCERDGHNSLNCPYENDIF
ncbi:hypothetical protein CANTEDRAFT_128289 [Yamadazyma tenuis ATCC 10573]|uniref:CAP-Gly domain-containing protein n=1 Tax=Candida tenuis (strain ATCC 10573 / BCRC 21748 / CBS 615 / JCM 9827 / NBRC 10315 / NRRL Y-1498 / VKM Y-70) TaxID=590646 RepID=G3BFU7_CANTC|nr:uncharacterized protein CANTEDRAFT_128289 [Yamadazyma tenuis ATCC 10573]EGV60733.1 hypothetical protein CANTEDRAFT_128289 [Yamadazyma tenuis ATCC 10573]